MSIRTCDHLKEDGILCGSPALRGEKLCYFHHRDHKRTLYAASAIRRADVLGPSLPRMKSFADIQVALYEVMTAIVSNRVSHQRAGRQCPFTSESRSRNSHATPYGSIFYV